MWARASTSWHSRAAAGVWLAMSALTGRCRCHIPHAINGFASCSLFYGMRCIITLFEASLCTSWRVSLAVVSDASPFRTPMCQSNLLKLMKMFVKLYIYMLVYEYNGVNESFTIFLMNNDFWVANSVSQNIHAINGAVFYHLKRSSLYDCLIWLYRVYCSGAVGSPAFSRQKLVILSLVCLCRFTSV